MTALGKLIDQRLDAKGWERRQLAEELGIVAVSVSRWLRPEGDYPVPWRHYPQLSALLDVPIHRILAAAGEDAPHYVTLFHQFFSARVVHAPNRRRR